MKFKRLMISAIASVLVVVFSFSAWANSALRTRAFKLKYQVQVRDIGKEAHVLEVWLPLPQSDANQTIHRLTIDAPQPLTIARESSFGNQLLYVRVEKFQETVPITLEIAATRRENAGRDEALTPQQKALYLAAEPLVPIDGPVKSLADEATRGLTTDAEKARAIYNKVIQTMTYDKTGTGWGRGDALYACEVKRGNCTDFHALLIGMARSAGIPGRFAIGFSLPEAAGSGEIPGYHCWAELYLNGRGWVPVDSSEAWRHPAKHDYYFGHHDENRLEFSRGRNLRLTPAQHGPPLNFLVYPHAEVDGKTHAAIDLKFTYEDLNPDSSSR